MGTLQDRKVARDSRPHTIQQRPLSPDSHKAKSEKVRLGKMDNSGSRFGQSILFARNFLKYPNLVGWMLPSSPFVVAQVLRQVDWKRARVIVEYGPGIGTFTKQILRQMHPDAVLLALEVNGDFVRFLRGTLHDPRLRLVHGSAADVDVELARLGHKSADYVISGIPFKTLPEEVCNRVAHKTHSVLHPKGAFLVYQLSSAALPYLERVFGSVRRDFEWLSILPARLFYCVR